MRDVAAVDSGTMEPLPVYAEQDGPRSVFDIIFARMAAHVRYPDDEVILQSFIESQKAPAYNTPKKAEAPKPIDHYPPGSKPHTDTLTRVKQEIVEELFSSVSREDSEAIALLIQNNLVTANTTSEAGRTPLLEAIATKNIAIVKELLDFGADVNAFGVVVCLYSLSQSQSHTPYLPPYP
jgi:ankyrin repeat protein